MYKISPRINKKIEVKNNKNNIKSYNRKKISQGLHLKVFFTV